MNSIPRRLTSKPTEASCTVGCLTLVLVFAFNLALMGGMVWFVVSILQAMGVLT